MSGRCSASCTADRQAEQSYMTSCTTDKQAAPNCAACCCVAGTTPLMMTMRMLQRRTRLCRRTAPPTGSQQAKVCDCLDPQEDVGRHGLHDSISSCHHTCQGQWGAELACSCLQLQCLSPGSAGQLHGLTTALLWPAPVGAHLHQTDPCLLLTLSQQEPACPAPLGLHKQQAPPTEELAPCLACLPGH